MCSSVVTTARRPWRAGSCPRRLKGPSNGVAPDLEVGDVEGRPWLGFGGCFNELGWRALGSLPARERARVLDRLFAPGEGLGFEFCRLPIGANDYAEDWYSHAETPGDFALKHFSIERDRRALLPFVREAKRR